MTPTNRQRLAYLCGDYLTLNVGWFGFNMLRFATLPVGFRTDLVQWLLTSQVMLGQLIMPPLIMCLYWLSGYYSQVFYKSRLAELGNTALVSLIAMVGIFFSVLIDDSIPERMTGYELMVMLWLMLFLPTYLVRLLLTSRVVRRIRRGDLAFNTLIVGATSAGAELATRLDGYLSHMGKRVIGYVRTPYDGPPCELDRPVYELDKIEPVCRGRQVTSLIVMPSPGGRRKTLDLINRLLQLNVAVYLPPDIYHLVAARGKMESLVGEPLLNISSANISASTANVKRLCDVVVSALALILLAPLFAVIALVIRLDSPGPVFYRQQRVGRGKRLFDIIKFRSMATDAETGGPALSSDSDPRITRPGHFLRKYRLDELPQFWNVLKGDMSLVGPRPERPYYVDQLVQRAPYYSLIHQVRPGITSLGMVKFGYASTVDEMIQRLRYDLLYLENVSLSTDIKILLHTIETVVTGRGV